MTGREKIGVMGSGREGRTSHVFPEMNRSLLAAVPNAIYLEYMPWFEPLSLPGSCYAR